MNENRISWPKKLAIVLSLSLFLILVLLLGLSFFSPPQKAPLEQTREPEYEILYKKTQDTTGRTLFYQQRGFYDGIGTGLRDVVGGRVNVEYVAGAVSSSGLMSIQDTNDFYILLVDPQTGEELSGKIRILGVDKDDLRATKIVVEDLDEPAQTAQNLIGFADLLLKEDLEKLVRPGDGVAVEFYVRQDSVFDDQGRRIIESLVLRRYGGLEQIRKELAGEGDLIEFLR